MKNTELQENNPIEHFNNGLLCLKQQPRDITQALIKFSEAIEVNPKYIEVYGARAELYEELNEIEKSLADYCKAVELNPKLKAIYCKSSRLYKRLGEAYEGVIQCNKAITLNPLDARAYHYRGFYYHLLGNLEQAIKDSSKAIELFSSRTEFEKWFAKWNPGDLDVVTTYSNRAFFYYQQGNIELAFEDYNTAEKINRENKSIYSNRMDLHEHLGKNEKALEDASRDIKLRQTPMSYLRRAVLYKQQGNIELAFEDYNTALKREPQLRIPLDHMINYVLFGFVCEQQGKDQEALEAYSEAMEINPRYTKAFYLRGMLHQKLGNSEAAIADYKKVIEFSPLRAEPYYSLAGLYEKLGKFDDAIACYTKLIAIRPEDLNAHRNRAILNEKLEKFDDAIADYKKVIEFSPLRAEPYHSLAVLYEKLGKFDDALACYTKLIAIHPEDLNAHRNRAILNEKLGKFDDAIADYEKLMEYSSEIKRRVSCLYEKKATIYEQQGNIDAAWEAFKKHMDLMGIEYIRPYLVTKIYYRYGSLCKKLGKIEDALVAFNTVIKVAPQFSEAYKARSECYVLLAEQDLLTCKKLGGVQEPDKKDVRLSDLSIFKKEPEKQNDESLKRENEKSPVSLTKGSDAE